MDPKEPRTDEVQAEENPFAGFQSEGFDAGEPLEEEAPSADTEDDDADPDEDADDPGEEEGQGSADADPGDEQPRPPRKKNAKSRIDELTREKHEARREAEALRQRLEALEKSAEPDETAEEAEPTPEGPKEPSPDDFEYGELDPGYVRALARYEAKLEWAELKAAEQQQRQRDAEAAHRNEVRTRFQQQAEAAAAKYEDFQEVVVTGAQRGEWPLSQTVAELLVESDVGADIAYHLASQPDVAAALYALSPAQQARQFGRLEAQFSADQAAAGDTPGKTPAKPKAPAAPPPPTERTRGKGGRFQTPAHTDDFEAFEAMVMENN